jgi:hypothetical protein
MSDFFSNMINRHLGTMDVVRPRPRARFEPANRVTEVNAPIDTLEARQSPWRQENEFRPVSDRSTKADMRFETKDGYSNVSNPQGPAPVFEAGKLESRRHTEAPINEAQQRRTSQTQKRQPSPAEKQLLPNERSQQESYFNLAATQEHRTSVFEPTTSGAAEPRTAVTPPLATHRQRDAETGNEKRIVQAQQHALAGEREPTQMPGKAMPVVGYSGSELDNRIEQMSARLRNDQSFGPSPESGQQDAKTGNAGIAQAQRHAAGEREPPQMPAKAMPIMGHSGSEFDNRIEQMLERLRDDRNSGPDLDSGMDDSQPGGQSSPSEPMNRERYGSIQSPSVMPAQANHVEIEESVKTQLRALSHGLRIAGADKSPEQEISSTDRPRRHSGLLQPPPWLLDMQAEFNQRWREMNSKPEAERVINVTIGRVEVRAVPAEAPKQPKRNKQPSDIMSLDEYLNQRGRGGRT